MDPITGLFAIAGAAVNYVSARKKAKAEARANDQAAQAAARDAQFSREEAGFLREDALISREDSLNQLDADLQATNYNAALADQDADQVEQQYAQLERQQRILGTKALGSIEAGIAAGGFSLGLTGQDVLFESSTAAELDALNVRHEGLLKAKASREEATQLRMRAAGIGKAKDVVDQRTGVALARADLAGRRAGEQGSQALRIAANTGDIRRAGVYNAVSSTLSSLSSLATTTRRVRSYKKKGD